jgi:hypothetical protein
MIGADEFVKVRIQEAWCGSDLMPPCLSTKGSP